MSPHGFGYVVFPLPHGWPELTWVGPNPFGEGYCLGFDDGSIRLLKRDFTQATGSEPISASHEAVNGVAATSPHSIAVSTRSDVTFARMEDVRVVARVEYSGGAHGVVATRSGWFVSPLGPRGFLLVNPTKGHQQPMYLAAGTDEELYFYRAAALANADAQELLVFAGRRGGVGVVKFENSERGGIVRIGTFDGLDVVDVCGLGDDSHAAVAVSPKAELLWFQDVSSDAAPLAMKLSGIRGPVYRVLATARHLFVLSSKAFYVWANLVDALRSGRLPAPGFHSFEVPMEAVDFSLFDECIHFVMAQNALARFRISDLEAHLASNASTGEGAREARMDDTESEVTRFLPTWVTHDVTQETAIVS